MTLPCTGSLNSGTQKGNWPACFEVALRTTGSVQWLCYENSPQMKRGLAIILLVIGCAVIIYGLSEKDKGQASIDLGKTEINIGKKDSVFSPYFIAGGIAAIAGIVLLAKIEQQMDHGISTDPRCAGLSGRVDALRESILTPRPELFRDAARSCEQLKEVIEVILDTL